MAASYNLFHDGDVDADADTDDYCSYWQIIDMRSFYGISNQNMSITFHSIHGEFVTNVENIT